MELRRAHVAPALELLAAFQRLPAAVQAEIVAQFKVDTTATSDRLAKDLEARLAMSKQRVIGTDGRGGTSGGDAAAVALCRVTLQRRKLASVLAQARHGDRSGGAAEAAARAVARATARWHVPPRACRQPGRCGRAALASILLEGN